MTVDQAWLEDAAAAQALLSDTNMGITTIKGVCARHDDSCETGYVPALENRRTMSRVNTLIKRYEQLRDQVDQCERYGDDFGEVLIRLNTLYTLTLLELRTVQGIIADSAVRK